MVPIKAFWQEVLNLNNFFLNPVRYFRRLVQNPSWLPGSAALLMITLLFGATTVLAELNHIPFQETPLLNFKHYRLVQALFLVVIYSLGWWLCSIFYYYFLKLYREEKSLTYVAQVIGPSLFLPMVAMAWPTELALSMGLLNYTMSGFPGLWVRHLVPAMTFLYMLFMLWLLSMEAFTLLMKEAFTITMLSLLPVLVLWSFLLR